MKKTLYELIPKSKRDIYLKELLDYVVNKNGLASIPKSDLEACFVYLYKKHVNQNADIFELCNVFKIKESKLKNLMSLFFLKFDDYVEMSSEEIILDILKNAKFEIESFEKVQIQFNFTKIEYLPLFRSYFRKYNGTVKFDTSSETMILNQNRLYDVLNNIWEFYENAGEKVKTSEHLQSIQQIIGNIGNSIDNEMRDVLRKKPNCGFDKALSYGASLSGIGSIFIQLIEKIKS